MTSPEQPIRVKPMMRGLRGLCIRLYNGYMAHDAVLTRESLEEMNGFLQQIDQRLSTVAGLILGKAEQNEELPIEFRLAFDVAMALRKSLLQLATDTLQKHADLEEVTAELDDEEERKAAAQLIAESWESTTKLSEQMVRYDLLRLINATQFEPLISAPPSE